MTGWYLLAAVALLVANGFFVGAEFALVAARRSKLEQLAADGGLRARLSLKSMHQLSFMLAGAQLGITMASLGLGAVAEPAVAHLFEALFASWAVVPEGIIHSISLVLALTIVVYLHMVVGEMAPKNIAISEPERSALWLSVPFRAYANVFRPVIYVLNALANLGVRAMKVEPVDELRSAHSSAEIGLLISKSAAGGLIGRFEQRLLSGVIRFGNRDAAAVMVPRTDMVAAPASSTVDEIETLVLESGLSRIPVYGEDLDNILGFVHSKDLLKVDDPARGRPLPRHLIRDMFVVPESRRLHPLMRDMRRERQHFALVVDEHGGTAGVVTLEDLLEELVGEIQDEYDHRASDIESIGPDRYVVPGTIHVSELHDRTGLELPEGEYETVAGFLMDRLGRIPRRRDEVEHEGWRLRVLAMHRRRVLRVLVEQVERRPDEDAA